MKVDRFGAIRLGNKKGVRKTSLPMGTIVVRKDKGQKARYIKVAMEGPHDKRWQQYARWLWEENFGAVPEGMRVLHKDGKTLNDRLENLFLGTATDVVKLYHKIDPEMSRENYRKCREATAEMNRVKGKLSRLKAPIARYFYPVEDRLEIVYNTPFRRRKTLLAHFGLDVSAYPVNGQIRRWQAALDFPIRAVKGADLERGLLAGYFKVDPESGIRAFQQTKSEDPPWIERAMGSAFWGKVMEAARMDLKDRK